MGAKVKSIAILGDTKLVINQRDATGLKAGMNFATSVLGFNVNRLNVRLEVETGGSASGLPEKIPAEVRFRAPGSPKPVGATSSPDAKFTLRRAKPGLEYRADLPLTKLLFLMKQDTIPEVATVVRDGGTSDKKFRDPLVGASWNSRASPSSPTRARPT